MCNAACRESSCCSAPSVALALSSASCCWSDRDRRHRAGLADRAVARGGDDHDPGAATLRGSPARANGRSAMAVRKWAANLGLLDVLVRLRHGPANVRRSREAGTSLRKCSPGLQQGPDRDQPSDWTRHRFLPTVSDMAVITVGPPGQSPRAVIKLPTTARARAAMRQQIGCANRAPVGRSTRVLARRLADGAGERAGRQSSIRGPMEVPGVPASRMVRAPMGQPER